MLVYWLIGIILFFSDGSDFMRKEMSARELLVSSLFLHSIYGFLSSLGITLVAGLFFGYHTSNWVLDSQVTNGTYDALQILTCEDFIGNFVPNFFQKIIEDPFLEDFDIGVNWTFYLSPAVQMVIDLIMFIIAIKFIKLPLFIAMESVPANFQLKKFKNEVRAISVSISHFHIWNNGSEYIGSLSINCASLNQFLIDQRKIRTIALNQNLRNLTIEPILPKTFNKKEITHNSKMHYGERDGDSTDVFVYRTFKTTLYRTSQILAANSVHTTISKVSPENSHVSVNHV